MGGSLSQVWRDQGGNLVSAWHVQGGRTSPPRCGLKPLTQPKESMMRFYNQPHPFYAGIDLHARSLHLCVLDAQGQVRCDRSLPCQPHTLLDALEPFRDGLVVGVECLFAWYWLA